jgi:hypothetical protein
MAASLLYILTWAPGVAAVASTPMGSNAWLGSCIMMPASGVYMWGWAVSILENAQEGVQWGNLFVNIFDGNKYTVGRCRLTLSNPRWNLALETEV